MNNSYSTIPSITTNERGHLVVSYVIGDGNQRAWHIVPADFQSTALMQPLVSELIAHTYLLGVERGNNDVVDGQEADITRLQEELRVAVNDAAAQREANEALREASGPATPTENQLNELLQERATHIGQLGTELAAQREANASLAEQGRILLESRASRISELEAEVQRLIGVGEELTAERNALAEGNTDERVARLEAELAEERRVGQTWRDADAAAGARIEELIGARRRDREEFEAQLAVKDNRIVEMQQRFDRVMAEFDGIAQALLERAIEKSLCGDYETFVREVNARTRTLKLIVRDQRYTVTFDVDVDNSRISRELNNIGGVYDVSCEQLAQYRVSATIECSPNDIDQRVDDLSSELYGCTDVTDVNHVDTEEDHDG